MSRLSRGKKREQKRAVRSAACVATPITVHVPADGTGASVGGVPVLAAAGEEVQQAVLNHLHRLALTTGHPVLATITDERIGYVVPLRVHADGSSTFTAEPLHTAPPEGPVAGAPSQAPREQMPEPEGESAPTFPLRAVSEPQPLGESAPTFPFRAVSEPEPLGESAPTFPFRAVSEPEPLGESAPTSSYRAVSEPEPLGESAPTFPFRAVSEPEPLGESAPTFPFRAVSEPEPLGESAPTSPFRAVPESQPSGESAPTFPFRAVSEPEPLGESAPTFPFRAVPEPVESPAPGTVAAPTGEFGPPPVMGPRTADAPAADDGPPAPAPAADDGPPAPAPAADDGPPAPAPAADDGPPAPGAAAHKPASVRPGSVGTIPSVPAPARAVKPLVAPVPLDSDPEPDPKPTPARGFDAVAEAVLGDDPRATAGDGGTALLAEPVARINLAVKDGRIEEAAGLAERTVAESSSTLGPEHPEVLRLRELTAYIAYLAADPLRSFHLSLDLARIRRRAGDGEAAYGNVQSAATAWRAIRDPEEGLRLGRDLIGLWTELTTEDGPAAEDIEQLESARARMGRLTERARRAAPPATG
ncbi:tetratricopeptide repeat protein [Streptomyces sp. NPDC046197]|uniref:tetratricopeptide repeat protein n=1 Tax=Streptomyces sp. NPDC046197 TaxID=3154337 RepID=UPI0033C67D4B